MTSNLESSDYGFGIVALAAYQPPPDLFAAQLKSIQALSYTNYLCLIAADGGSANVRATVGSVCGDDPRFRVIGFEERVGFYRNFERILASVPPHAQWVALSDQDDRWYPDKLSVLLPYLNRFSLVSGQAKVTSVHEGGVESVTARSNVPVLDLFAENQVTGSLSILRRDLLDLALPFPKMATPAQYHDHWLGVCAAADRGVIIVDREVQEYVQHAGNVVGESVPSLMASARHAMELAGKYEGSKSPRALARLVYKAGIGWRHIMAATLARRLRQPNANIRAALDVYGPGHHTGAVLAVIWRGVRRGNIPLKRALEIIASLPLARFSSGQDD